MSTSGTFTWTLTRDQLITLAYQRCGALEEADVPSTAQYNMAATFLESLFKSLPNDLANKFTFGWVVQEIVASTQKLGTDGLNYRCIKSHTSSTATNKPITGTQWSYVWVQDGSSGDAWANAQSYVSAGQFALPAGTIGINQAFIRYLNQDFPLYILSAEKYAPIISKGASALPEALYVDSDAGIVYLEPQPDQASPNYILVYQKVESMEDVGTSALNLDFPTKGLHMLSYGLAVDLALGPLGLPEQRVLFLKQQYKEARLSYKYGTMAYRGAEKVLPNTMVV